MNIRIFGGILIVLGCGGFGFLLASQHKKEERGLQELIRALDFMQCELQYRLTPLPELCRLTAGQASGAVRQLFEGLARELEDQISPDVDLCMRSAAAKVRDLPEKCGAMALCLGRTLGRFDLEGQLHGLAAARQDCRRELDALSQNRGERLRSYQTLGLCAGAAIAILFI